MSEIINTLNKNVYGELNIDIGEINRFRRDDCTSLENKFENLVKMKNCQN